MKGEGESESENSWNLGTVLTASRPQHPPPQSCPNCSLFHCCSAKDGGSSPSKSTHGPNCCPFPEENSSKVGLGVSLAALSIYLLIPWHSFNIVRLGILMTLPFPSFYYPRRSTITTIITCWFNGSFVHWSKEYYSIRLKLVFGSNIPSKNPHMLWFLTRNRQLV